jgi:DNA-binding MarR family transcriptional regulator
VPADVPVPEVAQALRLTLGRLGRRLRRLQVDVGPADGITFLELALLVRLARDGACAVSDLARGEKVTSQAVSAAVAGLQRRGLADTAVDPQDRRRTLVAINGAGRQELSSREDVLIQRLSAALAHRFSPAELRRLQQATALLDRLADLL